MSSAKVAIPPPESLPVTAETAPTNARPEPRWSLGFVAMLLYLFVEYMRLSAQYPVFQFIQVGKVVVGLAFLGWLIAPRIRGDRTVIRHLDLGLGFFLLAMFISACFAGDQESAWITVWDYVRWILVYFLISRIIVSSWRQRIFMFLLLLLNLKMAQAAIRGFYGIKEYGRSDEFLARIGVGAGSVGFFANAGDFGVAMCVVWPLAGMLLLTEQKKIPRLILIASFIGFSGAVIVCGSRGAVVGVVVTALVALARNPRRLGAALLVLIFIPALVYILPSASKDRMRSGMNWEEDKTASHRIDLWEAGLRMFGDHPILGVGPGNYAAEYSTTYAEPDEDPAGWAPHSIYIQTLSELGLVGASALIFLFFTCFRLNARTRKYLGRDPARRKSFEYSLAFGLDLALVGYLVSGAFLTVLYYPHAWIVFGISAGLHTAVTSRPNLAKEAETAPHGLVPASAES